MLRKIIQIDEEKCNGCGACASACAEGAIAMVDGKARLIRDDYCDGLGACLPHCPADAITFVEREAAAYDEDAVKTHLAQQGKTHHALADNAPVMTPPPGGCPGSRARAIRRATEAAPAAAAPAESCLSQWPVQIKLAPLQAPYFDGANLLVAADCAAYAYAGFHHRFMRNHITLIGCPKLDEGDYSEKLTEIIRRNNIRSLTVVRMEVPCCGGIERACVTALQNSGKFIPWQVVTLSTEGETLDD